MRGIALAAALVPLLPIAIGVAPAQATTAEFRDIGTFTTPRLVHEGVIVTGSADVSVREFNGLGIVSQFDFATLEDGERAAFAFVSPAVEDVVVLLSFSNSISTVELEAFAIGGASLGTITIGPRLPVEIDVSGLFGEVLLESFALTSPGAPLRVGSVTYTPVPEPASSLLLAGGLICLAQQRLVRARNARLGRESELA